MSPNSSIHNHPHENRTREQLIEELSEIRKRYDQVSQELDLFRTGASRERDKKLFSLLEHMPIPIQGYSCEGVVTLWNKASERLYGFTAAEAVGKNLIDLIIPPVLQDVFETSLENCKLLSASGYFQPSGEIQLLHKDGHLVPVYSTHIATVQPDCAPALYCLDIDLTQYKAAEQALKAENTRLNTLMAVSRDGIAIINQEHRVVNANRRFAEMLGYSMAEVLGMHTWDFEATMTEAQIRTEFRDLSQTNSIFQSKHRRKDGTIYDVEVCAGGAMVLNEPMVLTMTRDITDRKRAEVERENLQRQLVQAQKMEAVGHLAGGVAHDFNNKLSVILGNAELALEVLEPSQPVHEYVAGIQEAARRSAELTRKLLAFARKQTIAPKVIDLNETVEGMLKMLRRLIGEGVQLSWAPGQDLWTVNMDASQIDQILANLCLNARDAIGGMGLITIRTGNTVIDPAHCATHPGLSAGPYVMLAVSDNGCGIAPDIREHIFEPFFTTKGTGKGTGLGLATVYGIVKQNQGFIDLASEPGAGTTFTIYFPRHEGNADLVNPPLPRATVTGGGETILLVEDEEEVLGLIKLILERQGYVVLTASSPLEAIRLAKTNVGKIDLLITDVIMPEMNGQQLSRQLLPAFPGLKLLFISGYTADVIAHHGVLDRGVDFIQKPFSIERVAHKVREVLDRK